MVISVAVVALTIREKKLAKELEDLDVATKAKPPPQDFVPGEPKGWASLP